MLDSQAAGAEGSQVGSREGRRVGEGEGVGLFVAQGPEDPEGRAAMSNRYRALLAVRSGATINESDSRRFERVLEEVQGWWAQWCVNHYSALYEFDGAAPTMCDERRSGAAGFCRWHPQGAFIPDEEADDE